MFKANKGFEPDVTGEAFGQGAYNAIRVYLWAGLMHTADANTKALLDAFAPMARYVAKQGFPPEAIDIQTGTGLKAGPSGFSAAMLPFLAAKGDKAALQAQQNRIAAKPLRPKAYYEQALNLFAVGRLDGVYRFAVDGTLQPQWLQACPRR
jgi:endoglucanase